MRLKTAGDVGVDDYLKVIETSVLEWTPAEIERLTKLLDGMRDVSRRIARKLPKEIVFIKTSGAGESNAAYTRGNAVVLPQSRINTGDDAVVKLVWHELFHVLSRHNSELRNRLYATFGFALVAKFALPDDVGSHKITNPDAPHHRHAIRVTIDGREQWAVPVLLSKRSREQAGDGGEFFQFIELKLLLIDRDEASEAVRPLMEEGRSRLVPLDAAPDFFTQIGRNTGYIIHPEEIAADNFTLLARGDTDVPNPELLEKMRKILEAAK
ncbi:MAG: hypothetical protein QM775_03055 [Pirellulales bacterium]